MGRRAGGAWIFGALALAPAPAAAGAWVAPADGQTIHSEVLGERAGGYFLESQYFFERPLDAQTSFVARPWLESGAGAGAAGWRAEAEAGIKRALVRNRGGAVAVQGAALWRSDAPAGCSEGGVELRALAGASLAQGRAFFNAEAAHRAFGGGCGAMRVDVASGWRFGPSWLGLAEAFAHEESAGDASVKAQLSLVRFDRDGRGIQLGVRVRVDGEAAEPALVLAFWNDR